MADNLANRLIAALNAGSFSPAEQAKIVNALDEFDQLTADLAAVRAERDEYTAALLRTNATVLKYRDEYDEDSQMLREISHDIDGTLMQFDPEFATPADPQDAKEAPSA